MQITKRNNVRVLGKGKTPMIFAHGFGCDQNMWRFVVPAFEENYQVILFDYVGAGKSDLSAYNEEKYRGLNGYAQDLLDVCMSLDLKDAIFVGHSVSSMIGILASIKEPKYFSNLVLVGPSPCYLNDGDYTGGFSKADIEELLDTMEKNYIGWANFLAPAIMQNPDHPELADELTGSFCATDPKIAREFAIATFLSDNRADLPKVTRPSLILQCSEDIIAPDAVGKYLHEHLKGSKLVQLTATGHCPHLSAPKETIFQISAYLSSMKEVVHG